MKSKLVIVIGCIGILLIFYMYTRSNSNANDTHLPKPETDAQNAESQHMNDQSDHLFQFVQISDIHISIFARPKRISDFRTFVHETLDVIKPPVVVASGDLTDARGRDSFISQQYEDEWKTYNEILSTANVLNRTKWLDLRGNHDNFNVPSAMANSSLFNRYSMQGPKHKRSYMELVRDSNGNVYAFFAIDACLQPGPKRPYNFVGLLTQEDTDLIQHLVDEAKRAGVSNAIWFGHYPTSCIVTKNKEDRSVKRLIADYDASLAYLSGHLHSLGGFIPHMYALQEDKFFELEVADWKETRRYRVAAIDHGLLSFVDVNFGEWPIVLITNPKNSLFQIPSRKEAKVQLESTHIRILAFSPMGISSCTVKIGKDFNENCKQVNDNLFVVPWSPEHYREGLHHMTVTVVDKSDRKNEVTQSFRLDEKQTVYFNTMAQFVLHTHAIVIFKSMFWISILLCIAPLIFFRIWHELVKAGLLRRMRANSRATMSIVQHYWILASVDRIFWPVILYCLYLAFGPWVYCELADGHYGFVFASGIYLNGAFLPGSLTFFYGCAQLVFCECPLNWVYSRCLAKRYNQVIGMPVKNHRGWSKNFSQILFYLIILIETALSILFCVLYGVSAFFLAIFRTWSVVLNIWLYYSARNVPEHALRSAITVWSGSEKVLNSDQQKLTDESHTS